ncbi:hypothetical protein EYV94_25750 [Puteibacter caeruleilacunae]|nr:hypothetical protein EYV94_25750 [Puteibacter caeruleilacunae]
MKDLFKLILAGVILVFVACENDDVLKHDPNETKNNIDLEYLDINANELSDIDIKDELRTSTGLAIIDRMLIYKEHQVRITNKSAEQLNISKSAFEFGVRTIRSMKEMGYNKEILPFKRLKSANNESNDQNKKVDCFAYALSALSNTRRGKIEKVIKDNVTYDYDTYGIKLADCMAFLTYFVDGFALRPYQLSGYNDEDLMGAVIIGNGHAANFYKRMDEIVLCTDSQGGGIWYIEINNIDLAYVKNEKKD